MSLENSIRGRTVLEIVSASLPEALSSLSADGIFLENVQYLSQLTVTCTAERKDVPRIREILTRKGASVKVIKHIGLRVLLPGIFKRPVILFGFVILLLLTALLPTRVLFISVEGNTDISETSILDAAERAGISFGALRKNMRSESVKNALLEEIPELEWLGINTFGCNAVISVKERQAEKRDDKAPGVTSIVSERDGVITRCTVLKGNQLCKPGDAVKKGQVLVSGYTDCGIGILAQQAEGEIFAKTRHYISAVSPEILSVRESDGREVKRISLILGKKLINLFQDSGIYGSTCVRMYKEYYMTLPGGFQLPVGLLLETSHYYDITPSEKQSECKHDFINREAERYLRGHMIAGDVLASNPSFLCTADVCILNGTYICEEMIGRNQNEEIIRYNGENG